MTALAGQYHHHHAPKVAITLTSPGTSSPSPTKQGERVKHVKFSPSLSSHELSVPEERPPSTGEFFIFSKGYELRDHLHLYSIYGQCMAAG